LRRGAPALARGLLGQRLVRVVEGVRLAGVIVETEAYCGARDRAAHSFGPRRTARTEPMYGDGGTAYVYFTYGMHHCMNVVAGVRDDPQAVLLRALEPTEGLEVMRARRPRARREADLCSGPARLCEALGIDRALSGVDLLSHAGLWIERVRRAPIRGERVEVTPRVGVAYAGEWAARPLRFVIRGHPHASRPAKSSMVFPE